jgi:hypothetical protein
MSTHAVGRDARNRVGLRIRVSTHWAWLGGGFVLAFVVPFLLADRHAAFGPRPAGAGTSSAPATCGIPTR